MTRPAVIITDSVTGDYANGAVTFTFTFSEMIGAGEFILADISVEGGTAAGHADDDHRRCALYAGRYPRCRHQ